MLGTFAQKKKKKESAWEQTFETTSYQQIHIFHFLNNITYIFIHFFTYIYFKKLQTTLLKLFYQIPP